MTDSTVSAQVDNARAKGAWVLAAAIVLAIVGWLLASCATAVQQGSQPTGTCLMSDTTTTVATGVTYDECKEKCPTCWWLGK